MLAFRALFNFMEWIKITDKLPEVGKRVLFRGKITWKTKLNPIDFFDDELTREEETLEQKKLHFYKALAYKRVHILRKFEKELF